MNLRILCSSVIVNHHMKVTAMLCEWRSPICYGSPKFPFIIATVAFIDIVLWMVRPYIVIGSAKCSKTCCCSCQCCSRNHYSFNYHWYGFAFFNFHVLPSLNDSRYVIPCKVLFIIGYNWSDCSISFRFVCLEDYILKVESEIYDFFMNGTDFTVYSGCIDCPFSTGIVECEKAIVRYCTFT